MHVKTTNTLKIDELEKEVARLSNGATIDREALFEVMDMVLGMHEWIHWSTLFSNHHMHRENIKDFKRRFEMFVQFEGFHEFYSERAKEREDGYRKHYRERGLIK